MASRPSTGALLALIAIGLTSPAHAFFPFITDDTGTQGQGGSQVELNYEFVKEHNDELDLEDRVVGTETGVVNALASSYTYGVTDNLDVFLGAARQTTPSNGWLNTEIGAKWVFWGDQTQGWSAAVKPTVLLPVSKHMQDRGLGNAQTNVAMTLVSSFMADTHELHLNLDYTSNRYASTQESEAQRKSLWRISAAPVYVLNDQWKAGLDLGIETNPTFSSSYQAFGGIGLQYAPMPNLQIGLGLIGATALNSTENGWSLAVTTGVAYQF
jgi:hypothetical protein